MTEIAKLQETPWIERQLNNMAETQLHSQEYFSKELVCTQILAIQQHVVRQWTLS